MEVQLIMTSERSRQVPFQSVERKQVDDPAKD